MYNIDEIRANYKSFTDARIIRIAKQESQSLKREVVPVLLAEIKRRGLGTDLVQWVEAETRELSSPERAALLKIITSSTCPNCQQNSELRGYRYDTLIGALITSFDSSQTSIICKNCGKRDLRKSLSLSLLLGWWSVPSFLRMPFLLVGKLNDYVKRDKVSADLLNGLIDQHKGRILLSDDAEKEIGLIVQEFNRANEQEYLS
ncbi:MAG: hypothetical protein AAFZ63_02845 [Bacteroidota bacterium]